MISPSVKSSIFHIILKNISVFFLVCGLRRHKRIFWIQISHFAEYLDLCGSIIIIQRKRTHIISDLKSPPVTYDEHLRITMKYGCLTWLSRVKTGIDNESLIKDWPQRPSVSALKYYHLKNVFIACTNFQV